jgi:hypothetical protein
LAARAGRSRSPTRCGRKISNGNDHHHLRAIARKMIEMAEGGDLQGKTCVRFPCSVGAAARLVASTDRRTGILQF